MTRGQNSTRTTVKKTNPFTGGRASDTISGKPRLRPMDLPRNKETTALPSVPCLNKDVLSRNISSSSRTEHRTFYDNPNSVRQWAAKTDSNISVDFTEYGPAGGFGNDLAMTSGALQIPGSFSVSCSNVSNVSCATTNGFPYDGLCTSGARSTLHRMNTGFEAQQGLADNGNFDFMNQYDGWNFSAPAAEELLYSTSAASYPIGNDGVMAEPRFTDWPSAPFPSDDVVPGTDFAASSRPLAWSPVSASDPSVSSSYSRNSFLAIQPNTPLSPIAQESAWSPGQNGIQEEETGFYPEFSLGEALSLPATCPNAQFDTMSTLKPSKPFQRAPIPDTDFWNQGDAQAQAYPGSFMDVPYTRRSSEGETTATAREHPLYQVGPKEDGLYHCPFAGKEDCSHKPEKLKCNYDKHLDSHLKPYRCKLSSCTSLAFSSTACLLRHEREAHGMHGHGDKPHLCTYTDCERSIPGNGFPRRWNLFDHMKRVHDYTGPASSTGSTSPTPSSASSFCQGQATLAIGKRRPSSPPQSEPMKKTRSNISTKPAVKGGKGGASASIQGKQKPSIKQQWRQQLGAINARMASLDPSDTLGLEQINADYTILQTMAMKIRRQEASHYAN